MFYIFSSSCEKGLSEPVTCFKSLAIVNWHQRSWGLEKRRYLLDVMFILVACGCGTQCNYIKCFIFLGMGVWGTEPVVLCHVLHSMLCLRLVMYLYIVKSFARWFCLHVSSCSPSTVMRNFGLKSEKVGLQFGAW